MSGTQDNSGELFTGDLVKSRRIIYTPSDFAKSNLLSLQEVGTLTALQPHGSARSDLSSYLFFVVIAGSGSLKYNHVEFPLSSGDCAFINCQTPYRHLSSKNLWTLKWVHFNGPTMEGIYDKYLERGGTPVWKASHTQSVMELIDSIYTLASGNSYLRDMEIHEKLTSLLLFLMQESWNENTHEPTESQPTKRQTLTTLKNYLAAHYIQKIRLDDLALKFGINKFYLTHLFKKSYGLTINRFLLQARITKAKHFLRFTDWSIEKVALQVGYEEVNFFIRMFKKIEGITPGVYRNKWQSPPPQVSNE